MRKRSRSISSRRSRRGGRPHDRRIAEFPQPTRANGSQWIIRSPIRGPFYTAFERTDRSWQSGRKDETNDLRSREQNPRSGTTQMNDGPRAPAGPTHTDDDRSMLADARVLAPHGAPPVLPSGGTGAGLKPTPERINQ